MIMTPQEFKSQLLSVHDTFELIEALDSVAYDLEELGGESIAAGYYVREAMQNLEILWELAHTNFSMSVSSPEA